MRSNDGRLRFLSRSLYQSGQRNAVGNPWRDGKTLHIRNRARWNHFPSEAIVNPWSRRSRPGSAIPTTVFTRGQTRPAIRLWRVPERASAF